IIVGVIVGPFTIANFLSGYRERRQRRVDATPVAMATINQGVYEGGWRSVQLHLAPRGGDWRNFPLHAWIITRPRLLSPCPGALLARAQNDDYAAGIFFPENTVRLLEGKAEGMPQRFALEFFIRFNGPDRGKRARFKVDFRHVRDRRCHTVRVWAMVPPDA